MKDILLCQHDRFNSCSACCGIYNYSKTGKKELTSCLKARTERFKMMVRSPEDLSGYSAWVKKTESSDSRLEVIYNCEYVIKFFKNKKINKD